MKKLKYDICFIINFIVAVIRGINEVKNKDQMEGKEMTVKITLANKKNKNVAVNARTVKLDKNMTSIPVLFRPILECMLSGDKFVFESKGQETTYEVVDE